MLHVTLVSESWSQMLQKEKCVFFHNLLQYKHQEFQFPLLDAVHCGTESEHQVSNGSLIGLFSLFILSPFTRILELRTK